MTLKQKKITLYTVFVVIMVAMSFSQKRNAKNFDKALIKEEITISNRVAFDQVYAKTLAKTTMVVFLGTIAMTSIAIFLIQMPKEDNES